MISPTGKGIRVDAQGDGHYGTARGTRRHRGEDYLCDEGQDIVAPFDMIVTRVSKPKADSEMTGIAWQRGKSEGRMWYFTPHASILGQSVMQGQVIGTAQSCAKDYGLAKGQVKPGKEMLDHIHFQVNK